MKRAISVMPGTIEKVRAEAIVRAALSRGVVSADRRFFYPYFWFLFRQRATTWLGTTALRVSCAIDARTGVGATTDPFVPAATEADEAHVLEARVGEESALEAARKYARYVLRHRRKALVSPELELLQQALVYRPFWVVRCRTEGAPPFRVLVDGVTARFHVLARASSEGAGVQGLAAG